MSKKAGRPKIEFDEKDFSALERMATIQCTQKEMAGVMRVDADTLTRIIKEHYGVNNFSEWYDMFSSDGKMSLRRIQFKAAMKGNTALLKHLGKHWLGQSDRKNSNGNENGKIDELMEFLEKDGGSDGTK